jgi:tetratricopeptide (TPR) repeat protein
MSSLYDFSKHIRSLTSNKQYKDALDYFKKNKIQFDNEEIANNEYLVSDILSCLRRTNYLDAGFQFLQAYRIEINGETKERILTAYGWLLWSKYKSENSNATSSDEQNYLFDEDDESIPYENVNYNKNELISRIESLIPLLMEFNSDFSQTLISNLFSIVLKSEKAKPTPNWQLVNDFCDHFEPDQLSLACSTIQVKRKGQLRDMELASDRESWYAYKTKALSKLGKWQECFDRSKEALEALDNFHYSNDVWFLRRIALSKKNSGNTEDAIAELEAILKRKNEWFIQKELANLYFENEDYEQAYKYSVDAINNFGLIEYKIDLLNLMGKIYQSKGEANLALKHFSLSKNIRQKEGWKIPQKLIEELKKFSDEDVKAINTGNLESELKKYWQSLVPKRQEISKSGLLEGVIFKLLNNNERGKDGFLKSGSKEYYFRLSANFPLTPQIDVKSQVMFEVCPSADGKRDMARIKKVEN